MQGDVDDCADWDDGDDDGQVPLVPKAVQTPTAEEVEEHNATHIPFKHWCPACVEGKKPNPPHRRVVEHGRAVPQFGNSFSVVVDACT